MINSRYQWWPFFRAIILGLAAGAGAGVITTIWTSRALTEYAQQLLAAQHIPEVTSTQPTPIPGTYEEALTRVRDHAKTGVALFFPASIDATSPSAWISSSDVVAYGAVVSDDGWIACDGAAFDDVDTIKNTLEVWIAQTRYGITDVVEDSATGLVLVHVEGKNFVSADFAATDDVKSGTMMFTTTDTSVRPTSLVESDARTSNGVVAAETFGTEWQLADTASLSMPVFNAGGDLAGFAHANSDRAIPLHHVITVIRDVVKSGAITSPGIGMYGVDLSDAFAITSSVRQDLRAGFLVVAPNAAKKAILTQGPATSAGIALGDVILAVDGETISHTTTFAELLSQYDVGNTARLTVYRGGETVMISVTLEDANAMVY